MGGEWCEDSIFKAIWRATEGNTATYSSTRWMDSAFIEGWWLDFTPCRDQEATASRGTAHRSGSLSCGDQEYTGLHLKLVVL